MSAHFLTPSTRSTECSARSTKMASPGAKAAHIVDPENREEHLKRLAEAGINVQEMIGTGRLEVVPWTDAYVRDHRFDQDAMLASVEKLIQSGAAAGYALTRLGGHHMD